MSININHQVSVLVPVFNRSEYIYDCLQSIFMQTHQNFKVIIYDDGSSDDTVSIIKKYRKNLSLREKTKLQLLEGCEHKGVGFARNVLLGVIDTPYACWQDSDDLMVGNRIENQLKCLLQHNYEIVYCFMENISNTGKHISYVEIDVEKYSDDMQTLNHNLACATGLFVSKLKQYPFPNELTLGGEDVIWLYQLIKDSRRIGCCNDALYRYRYHPGRISHIKKSEINLEIKKNETDFAEHLISKISNKETVLNQ